jgi:hypothetical protein
LPRGGGCIVEILDDRKRARFPFQPVFSTTEPAGS